MAELTLSDADHGAGGGEGGDKKAHTPCVRTRLARGHTRRPETSSGTPRSSPALSGPVTLTLR